MTEEKYRELVDLVCSSHLRRPPRALFLNLKNESDTPDWMNKTMLARFLQYPEMHRRDEAIELYQEALEESDGIEMDQDAIDQKAWILKDLSILENHRGDNEKALEYILQAIQIANSSSYVYSFTIRGELVLTKFDILYELGREAEADAEADRLIEEHTDSKYINDSYLYFSYIYKAKRAADSNNLVKAKEFLLKTFDGIKRFGECFESARVSLSKVEIEKLTCAEAMDWMLGCLPDTQTQILGWDMPEEADRSESK